MIKYQIHIEDTGETFSCSEEESVLIGMARLGRKGIPVGCRGGGCGVCKVQVLSGTYQSAVMSRAHISEQEQASGIVLACRIMPCSDLSLQVIGKMKKTVAGIRINQPA